MPAKLANDSSRLREQLTKLLTALCLCCAAATGASAERGTTGLHPERIFTLVDTDDPEDEPAVATAVAISPDGRLVAAGGDDHVIRVWNAETGKRLRRLAGHDDWVRAIQLDMKKGRLASVGNDHAVLLWDLKTGKRIINSQLARGPLTSVSFHPNREQLLTVGFGDALRLFSLSTGSLERHFKCPCRDTRSVAVSPDGHWMAAAGRNGRLRIWSLDDVEQPKNVPADTRRIYTVAMAPGSGQVATGGDGSSIRIWDLATGDLTAELPVRPAKVRSLLYLNDNLLASSGTDNKICIWDLPSQQIVRQLEGHTGTVAALSRDASGEKLVSSSYDTTVRIWNLAGRPAGTANLQTTGKLH